MDKLKHVLSGHRKSEDTSRSHESPTSSSTAEGQSHPIFDEMTGSKKGREGTLTASGGPYAQVKTTSGEPYSTLAQPDSEMHGKLEQVGPSAPLATAGTTHGEPTIGSTTTSGRPIDSSTTTSTNPTSSSPLTSTNPTTSSTTKSTDPTIGSTATSGDTLRPHANLSSKNSVNTALSEASIKSGVIGFGVGERQEHAALPNRTFPDDHLDRSQAVTSSDPIGAGRAEQSNLPSSSSTQPQTHPTTIAHERTDTNVQSAAARQPYESAVRKESYTADTDRSFPLAGGVARKSHEHSDPTHHKNIGEREPGTKEREVGVKEGHGREGLAGAAALATAVGASKAAHRSDEDKVENRGLGSDNIASEHTPLGTSQQSQPGNTTTGFVGSNTGPVGKTTADPVGTSATGPLGNTSSSTASGPLGTTASGPLGTTSGPTANTTGPLGNTSSSTSKGLIGNTTTGSTASGPLGTTTSGPLGTASGPTANTTGPLGNTTNAPLGTTSTNPTSSKTHQHNPLALAAATAAATSAASKSSPSAQDAGHNAQGRSLAEPAQPTAAGGLTSNTSNTRPTLGSCPHGTRSESHRHIPGEFPSPTPGDESRTFLDYRSGVEPVEGSTIAPQATSGQHESTIAPGTTSGQHELRHTGSLDQPASKSDAEHHYGRDAAALAGGVGAGAALGSLASSRKQETANTSSKPLYEEENPYSSKALDPRVTGEHASALESQRFDPQAKTEASPHVLGQTSNTTGVSDVTAPAPLASQAKTEAAPHHLGQTSDTTDLSSATGPTATHGVVESEASQHHYGRDAALVGAGAATAGGLRHELQRNDTPGTGTAVLPQDKSAPVSSTTAPHHPTSTSGMAPTSGNNTFFGTSGAPAPLVDTSSQQKQQPLGNLGHTTEPTTSQTAPPHVPAKESEHHYGRDAAIVGAGAATAGGLYAATRDDKTETGPASKTIGPHSSNVANIVDPRVQPDLEKQKTSTTTGPHKSDTLNRLDPRVEEKAGHKSEHHLGRDAAVAGGTGAAGYGAYEAAKSYDDHRSTQPGASMTEQRYDTSAPGATTSNPVPTKGQYDYNDPNTTSNVNRSSNLGTGAALGAGAGLGAAAYTSSKHADNTQNIPLHQQQDFASSAATGPVTQGTTAPRGTHGQDLAGHQRYDSTQEPKKDHDVRNAALLGTAGAAAAGGAAYGYNQHQDAERARLEKEQQERLKKEAHDREKEQHRLDKEHHKQEKEAHKLEKEQHKHDKEIAAAQHKHDKEVHAYEKEQKQHDKDLAAQEKEQRRLDKAAEKEGQHEGEGEGEKKHRLFGFLHRDKSKKEKGTTSQESSPRQSRDYTAATAGTVAAASRTSSSGDEHDPSSPRWKGKNKLHKDPPKGHPAREALEQQQLGAGAQTHDVPGAKREHIGVDGPIGHADQISGDHETRKGVFGAHDFSDSTTPQQGQHTVSEPRTGLPMNVGKYGAGTGGTDANPAIEGFRGDATTAGTGPTGTGPAGAGFGTGTGTGVGHGTGVSGAPQHAPADRSAGY